MLNVIKVCGIYCYTIGAEGKIKINEARGDYFFYPNVTLWGHFFFALAHNLSCKGQSVPPVESKIPFT